MSGFPPWIHQKQLFVKLGKINQLFQFLRKCDFLGGQRCSFLFHTQNEEKSQVCFLLFFGQFEWENGWAGKSQLWSLTKKRRDRPAGTTRNDSPSYHQAMPCTRSLSGKFLHFELLAEEGAQKTGSRGRVQNMRIGAWRRWQFNSIPPPPLPLMPSSGM